MFIDILVCSAKEQLKVGYGAIYVYIIIIYYFKPSGFSILSCKKGIGLRPRTVFTAKNGELLRLYPIMNSSTSKYLNDYWVSLSNLCAGF